MAAVLLDTTVVIDLLRGGLVRSRGCERFARPATFLTRVRSMSKRRCAGYARVRTSRRGLFAGLREAPLGDTEGWRAGEWRRDFAARGRTLTQADCLVAAAALSAGGRLATGNPRDFPMAELTVEHWPTGD